MENPIYLGDGVYATMVDDGTVMLTTGNHDPKEADNVVYLDDRTVSNFIKWIASGS